MTSTGTDWNTPPWIVQAAKEVLGGIDLDPCSNEHSVVRAFEEYRLDRGQDGLALPWWGRVFCNPPYGPGIDRWVLKAIGEERERRVQTVLLIPAAVETALWQDKILGDLPVCLLRGRVRFWRGGQPGAASCTRPVALVGVGVAYSTFTEVTARLGRVV